ncbi:MAG: M20/M25/M40 family metallo-hydrolase [Patescibacteria group bacterium]|jgi:succinyl-diaminopimelate desuccinylase
MLKAELIKLTAQLVKIDSSTSAGKRQTVSLVKKFFRFEKVFIKTHLKNNCPAIIISLKRRKTFDLILSGHLDVVPAPADQFKPIIKQGKMFGRGTGDMKAACAVMMLLLRDWSRLSLAPNVSLILTTDEESGGVNGTKYILAKEKYRSRLVVVPDGGTELKTIITDKKGVLQIKIKAYGRSAHGSRPFWGENAVDKLIQQYLQIRRLIPELKKRQWRPTMNLGKITGGDVVNKVPDYAEMDLDIRYLNSLDQKKIIRGIKKITPHFQILASGSPFHQDPDHRLVKIYQKIAGQVLQEKIKFATMEGSSDARFFSELNLPTIVTRIDAQNIHTNQEFVNLRALEKFYQIVWQLVEKMTEK